MIIDIVVACCRDLSGKFTGIAKDGEIPWKSSEDLEYFKNITMGKTVIMGRKTHEVIGRALPGRTNIVVGNRFHKKIPGCYYLRDCDSALELAEDLGNNQVFIIGGEGIYEYFIDNYKINTIYLTEIDEYHDCDRHFKTPDFRLAKTIPLSELATVKVLHGVNFEEENYLNLIQKAIKGTVKDDRTGVGTHSVFGEKLTFDLESFPLLTTKKVPWKMVLKELLWFISGSTDNKVLQDQNVHIWDGNTSREFLDNRGLSHLPSGDLGEMYGHLFRHYGAEYVNCKTDYTGQGIDQIEYVIETIKNDPNSRRIMMTSFSPSSVKNSCLYPCHGNIIQFYIRGDKLDCQMYQRSADIGLGLPFNIASYAFLVYMIAHVTGYTPGILTIVTGDTHVYKTHIEPLSKQIVRTPYLFPRLEITRKVESIFDFKLDDFNIVEYRSYPEIKMEMCV